MLDGALARRTNRATQFGALLDSTLDRVGEAIVLFGMTVFFARNLSLAGIIATGMALVGSQMVSYIRARAEAINVIAASYPTASSVFQQRGYVPMNYGQQRMANLLQAEQGNFLTINTLARSARVTDGTASSYMSIIKRWAISRGGRIERTRNVVNGVRHGYKFRFTMTPVPVVQAPVTPVREGAITMSQLLATTARTSMTFEAIFGLAGADVLGFFLERKEDLR